MNALSLEPLIRRYFEAWGPMAYRFKWILFVLPLGLTIGLSFGLSRMGALRVDDPAYVFTPHDARWRRELNFFSKNWPLNENKFLPGRSFEIKRFVNVLIHAHDGGTILRDELLKEIQVLNDWISNNISVPTDDGRFNLTFQDLCLSYNWVCVGNEHIEMLLKRSKFGQFVNLSYPRGGNKASSLQDTPVYLGTVLGGVELFKKNNTVKSATFTQLFYFLKQEQATTRRYSTDFSYAVEKFFLRHYNSTKISISFAHHQSLQVRRSDSVEPTAPPASFPAMQHKNLSKRLCECTSEALTSIVM
ncbi:unnamed protein product [Heligmosomoides polygyrus]|uniref:Patched domain-containing protein 3 n=1 Tax=Heligmosomoides polygyrus TaxID=6339 RepID=A0A183GMF3_HELPZ|nr:unnamed protein product [Heligmosomoides polygyrus]